MSDHENRDEMEYCDLDPAKVCDNCCRCIESGKDYDDYDISLVHRIDEISDILGEEDMLLDSGFDELDMGQSGDIPPLKIDPILAAEWEKKLREI